MTDTPHWNADGYQRIVGVTCQLPHLTVEFADGTRACAEAQRLLPPDSDPVEWERLTWSPYEIAVPSAYEIVVIPWSTIRILTDKAYAAHLARAAEDAARRIGTRIRELRKARGLTGKELAERAGIAPQSLSRIEHGQHEVVLSTLQSLLAAMGCSLRDVATGATEAEVEAARR
jgi:DNA-binding XRE family transcriptional regulator